MASDSRITPLHDVHVALGGKMVNFAGWDMPLSYAVTGIAKEHIAVRKSAGIFDVSHMRRIYVTGTNAFDLLQYVLTNDASKLRPGYSQYSFLVKHSTIRPLTLDDAYLNRIGENEYLLIVNAANGVQDLEYILEVAANRRYKVSIKDETDSQSLIAVQGPRSREILEELVGTAAMRSLSSQNMIASAQFNNVQGLWVASTGYTGEPTRFEVVVPVAVVGEFWQASIERGATPAGLGARDSLRTEAGLLLYGHDINQATSPVEAGMGFAVRPDKDAETIGRDYLRAQKEAVTAGTLGWHQVLLEFPIRRQLEPQRFTSTILFEGQVIGEVTSSVVAPMVRDGEYVKDRGLAIGYEKIKLSHETIVSIDVRSSGTLQEATVMRRLLIKEPTTIGGLQYSNPETHYFKALQTA